MKTVFSWVLASLLLSGCPDTRTPQPPPRVPQPKIEIARLDCSAHHASVRRPACPVQRKG